MVLGVVIVCTVDGELMFFSKYKDNVINLIPTYQKKGNLIPVVQQQTMIWSPMNNKEPKTSTSNLTIIMSCLLHGEELIHDGDIYGPVQFSDPIHV